MDANRHEPLKVVYLGISGVLHPSQSLYELLEGRSPWEAGHRPYEAVPVLERVLRGWPEVRIVLTSTQPWSKGLPAVLTELGPELAARVMGFTYEDLTTKLRRGKRQRPLSDEDYWRLNKSEIVRLHVEWLRPVAWVAVDDETILWTERERRGHLVAVDGSKGLLWDAAAQDRLATLQEGNFGAVELSESLVDVLTKMPNVGEDVDFSRGSGR
ncbi:HAD domain-containing protein [Roseateles sp. MS654]|uniref:HAD domain-containing protein n=1 Tax=Roseateles sp. MS654 TaxID=3412685 RepID=UPI003C2D468B